MEMLTDPYPEKGWGQHNNIKKALPQLRQASAQGIELSNGCRRPANNRDLMCLSPGQTVALRPSKSIFLFFFSN